MQLHNLKIKDTSKSLKRKKIGRGGKRGTYSGRGIKGQKARAGHKILPAERVLIQRLPKMRGAKNKPKSAKNFIINLSQIEKLGLNEINREALLKKKIINSNFKGRIKILGNGNINTKVQVGKNILISKSAENKITKAQGQVDK